MTPPAKRLLPPCSSSLAASSITTLAPWSRAASAAHSAALPLPTTITSYGFIEFRILSNLVPGRLEQLLPAARQHNAPAGGGTLEMVAHVGARLVAAGVSRHQDLDHLRLDDDIHQALGVGRRRVFRRQDPVLDQPLEIERRGGRHARVVRRALRGDLDVVVE